MRPDGAAERGDVRMGYQAPLQQQAYDYLLEQIRKGAFRPGEIYSETRLAAEIGISRTPVKDALVRLSQDRTVDILPSRGFRLHRLTREDVFTTFQARTAVEGYCALELARDRASVRGQGTLGALRDCITQMERQIAGALDRSALLEQDLEFHRLLVGHAGNRELGRLYELLNHRVASIARESLALPGRPAQALAEHREILWAVGQAEDPFEPYRVVAAHLETTRDLMLELLGQE